MSKALLPALVLVACSTLLFGGSAPRPEKPSLAVVAPEAWDGAEVLDSGLEDQADRAGLIVVGRVTGVSSRLVPGSIETDVSVSVEQALKGSAGRSLTLTIPGGRVGPMRLVVGGVPNFLTNERVLLFLRGEKDLSLVQVWQSKFSLARDEAIQLESGTRISISELEARLGRRLGKPVVIGASQETTTLIGFTTYCYPWANSSLPVAFEVNGSNAGAGGASGSAFSRLVYNSWHNWEALADSYPSFRFTGPTTRDGSNHVDGITTIAWADLDSLGTGVIGVNYCTTLGSYRYEADSLIDNTGFTWDPDDSNGISSGALSLQSVLEHELGHGLGLGHSNAVCDGSAATPLMCPSIMVGVRKTILADDQAGAAYVYPLAGPASGAPSGLAVTAGSGTNSLQWASSAGSPLAYDIERSDSGCAGSFRSVQALPASSTTWTDNNFGDGLPAGSYCYRIRGLGQGGDSAYSNLAAPSTSTPTPSPTRTATPVATSTPLPTATPSAPASSSLNVARVLYWTEGGRGGTAHLRVAVTLLDGSGSAVPAAAVSIYLYRNGGYYASASGQTGSDGSVSFKFTNAPSGCYTEGLSISAAGKTWDGSIPQSLPADPFCK